MDATFIFLCVFVTLLTKVINCTINDLIKVWRSLVNVIAKFSSPAFCHKFPAVSLNKVYFYFFPDPIKGFQHNFLRVHFYYIFLWISSCDQGWNRVHRQDHLPKNTSKIIFFPISWSFLGSEFPLKWSYELWLTSVSVFSHFPL